MLNEAQISLSGYVATQPFTRTVGDGIMNVTMRVGWTPRRRDRVTGEWVDGNTSYVTVVCWRNLAVNVATCMRKGDPVVVKGRLSVRTYEKDGVTRTVAEVEASAVGHDLTRGVAQYQRVRPRIGKTASEYAADADGGGPAGYADGEAAAVVPPGAPDGLLAGMGQDETAGQRDAAGPLPAEPDADYLEDPGVGSPAGD